MLSLKLYVLHTLLYATLLACFANTVSDVFNVHHLLALELWVVSAAMSILPLGTGWSVLSSVWWRAISWINPFLDHTHSQKHHRRSWQRSRHSCKTVDMIAGRRALEVREWSYSLLHRNVSMCNNIDPRNVDTLFNDDCVLYIISIIFLYFQRH